MGNFFLKPFSCCNGSDDGDMNDTVKVKSDALIISEKCIINNKNIDSPNIKKNIKNKKSPFKENIKKDIIKLENDIINEFCCK